MAETHARRKHDAVGHGLRFFFAASLRPDECSGYFRNPITLRVDKWSFQKRNTSLDPKISQMKREFKCKNELNIRTCLEVCKSS